MIRTCDLFAPNQILAKLENRNSLCMIVVSRYRIATFAGLCTPFQAILYATYNDLNEIGDMNASKGMTGIVPAGGA